MSFQDTNPRTTCLVLPFLSVSIVIRPKISNSLCRSRVCSASVGNLSGQLEGSSTSEAHNTARQAANGRRAHHKWSVEGCPWRMDFSRADSILIASRGRATSISFFFIGNTKTQRTRRLVDEAFDTVFEDGDVEVDQESQPEFFEFEVGEQLGIVNGL